MSKNVMILSNHHSYTYNFRKEVIKELIDSGYKVYVVLPYGDKVENLIDMGCTFIDVNLDRRGKNPFKDLITIYSYFKSIKKINPIAVLTYTIKPSLYGGLVSKMLKIPYIPNITGLGSALEKNSLLKKVLLSTYRYVYKDAQKVFFQNEENLNLFLDKKIVKNNYQLIPGSGINTNNFPYKNYPSEENGLNFIFISRIMKEKGIEYFLEAAKVIKRENPKCNFIVCGFCEEDYENELNDLTQNGIIKYIGIQSDISKILSDVHCVIHPTFYPEGISNILLEASSTGRPVITTNRSGCREVVSDKTTGFLIKEHSLEDLINKINEFILLSSQEKIDMGVKAREKVSKEFNRKIIVDHYTQEILSIK